jgi:3-oxoacyl-[acyl-carrier-protein] synthase-3
MSIKIVGLGSYLPEKILTNSHIDDTGIGTNDEWTYKNLGILERRISEETELSSDLAVNSSLNAIKDAGLNVEDIDFIIMATSTPDRISPSTACLLQEKIGAFNAACVDINAVCPGFLYGLQIAKGLLSIGQYKNILLVAAETYSRITDTNNRDCVYFGDGSGAVVLSSSNNAWIASKIYSDPTGKDGFMTPINSTFIMNGKAVFEAGLKNLPLAIKEVWSNLNINVNDIKYLVPHQPSIKMLQSIAKSVDIPFEKVVTIMDRYANIAAASIPMALDTIVKQGKVNNGDILTLASVGSGWTWGAGVIKWDK